VRSSTLALAILVSLATLPVTACKSGYEPARFIDVCRAGTGYSGAAAYDPPHTGGADVPVAFVYKEADLQDWVLRDYVLPAPFAAGHVVPVKEGTRGRVQLALCVEQQAGPFNRDCNMNAMNARLQVGGDGDVPDVDVKSTGGTMVVKAYDSRYVVTVREARTGRALATRTLDVPSRMCPLLTLGATVGETRDYARIRDRDLVELLAPFLPESARAQVLAAPVTDDLF